MGLDGLGDEDSQFFLFLMSLISIPIAFSIVICFQYAVEKLMDAYQKLSLD